MRPTGARRRRASLSALVLGLAIVALLGTTPPLARASSIAPSSSDLPAQTSAPYSVTWNGVDVSSAGSASSALSIDLTQSASLFYNWSTGTAAPVTISDARLQMFYFGLAVSTRDQVVTNPVPQSHGSIPLSWVPVSVAYVLEGVYRLTASFIAPNGTTMWSENFYVRGSAQYGVGALLPIVLIVIIVYEVYSLVRSGRYAAIGRPPSAPPPAGPPGEAAPAEAPQNAPPPESSPPPDGGGP